MAIRHPSDLLRAARQATAGLDADEVVELLGQPLILLSVPRAGSNLLFEQLCRTPGAWSIGGESHAVFAAFPGLRAENSQFDSGALGMQHADAGTADDLRRCFLLLLRDSTGLHFGALPPEQRKPRPCWVEKTPRNALNIPFLLAVFPGARFVFLHRAPQPNIASIIDAWQTGLETGRFVTYPKLPGWDREGWCFLLPPGWRALRGESLAAIAAFQWTEGNRRILDDLQQLAGDRWTTVSYEGLTARPEAELARIAAFAGLVKGPSLPGGKLPLSKTTLTPPNPDKWRRHADEIDALQDEWQPVADRLSTL